MKITVDISLLRSLLVMGAVVEARDTYTGGHQWRVAQFAKALGERANLPEGDIFLLGLGGHLHDVGKVGISDALLHKPGKLDEREFAVMRTHSRIGADLLREHPIGELAIDIALHHHERFDGLGYPDGLEGDDISLNAKVLALADTMDALTSTRPYRKAMPVKFAVSILEDEHGKQFDPALTDQLLDLARSGALSHIIGHSDEGRPLAVCPKCGPVLALPRSVGDGDVIPCRSCTGKFRLHSRGETFEVEFTGELGSADDVRPQADLGQIDDLLKQAPREMTA